MKKIKIAYIKFHFCSFSSSSYWLETTLDLLDLLDLFDYEIALPLFILLEILDLSLLAFIFADVAFYLAVVVADETDGINCSFLLLKAFINYYVF